MPETHPATEEPPPGGERPIAILGATATGKTAVAVAVAEIVDGEVISLDSRQVYRGMDIGTAKPSPAERRGVPHHGFDVVDPDDRFNAGRFADAARSWMRGIAERGRVAILAGGTGFFLRALTHPMFDEPSLDEAVKERWKRYLAGMDTAELGRWAHRLDPASAARVGDRQRLSRVVEVAVLTGRPLSWWHRHAPPTGQPIDPLVFVLDLPRDVLVRRIDDRVDRMVGAGLVREVRALLAAGYDERDPGLNATGYIEIIPHLRGERALDEAVELVRVATRQFARRQTTWLRHQLPDGATWLDAQRPAAAIAAEIAAAWREGK